jgi:hypothetical protein
VSKRAWWLGGCLIAVMVGPRPATSVAGQASGLSIVVDKPTLAAGETLQMFVDADATGTAPVSVLVDGLGVTADSFVLRLPEALSGWCPPPSTQCGRCPDGRRCFNRYLPIDARTVPGRHELPVTVTDATGRQRRAVVAIDVRPPADDDGDGMADAWESFYFGFDLRQPRATADADPDGDGVSNFDEFRRDTNPLARYVQYFGEGSAGDRPPAHGHVVNVAGLRPNAGNSVWVRTIGDGGRHSVANLGGNSGDDWVFSLGGISPYSHQADRVVALVVESTAPTAALRDVYYVDGRRSWEGPFRARAMVPSTSWYFADGGTDGTLDTFFLTYNPGAEPVEATITYRLADGRVARRSARTIAPGGRTTIWTNVDDAALGHIQASAEITASAPIIVERAWRFDPPGRTVTQVTATPGVDRPSARWIVADADATAPFETTVVIANPSSREAVVEVAALFTDQETTAGRLRVPPGGRETIPVQQLADLRGRRGSLDIVSTNGVPIVVERTFLGRDAQGPWRLATPGAPAPAVGWVLPRSVAGAGTELVLANLSPFDGEVQLIFSKNDSYVFDSPVTRTVRVPARRRLVYPLGTDDPAFAYTPATARITSQATARGTAEIVVEAISYGAGEPDQRTRASGVLGIPVP